MLYLLRNSPLIQDNSIGVTLQGELPDILDRFLLIPQVITQV